MYKLCYVTSLFIDFEKLKAIEKSSNEFVKEIKVCDRSVT
jgi:hypothetical protein